MKSCNSLNYLNMEDCNWILSRGRLFSFPVTLFCKKSPEGSYNERLSGVKERRETICESPAASTASLFLSIRSLDLC